MRTEEKYPEVDSFVMVNVKQVGGPELPNPRDCRRPRTCPPSSKQD